MASPQKENGYTAISNELMEALARVRINGESRQVLDVILRKTYGFNKKRDRISLSQFEYFTGISRKNICRAITKLKDMKLIIVIPSEDGNTYQFQKDHDEWVVAKLPLGGSGVFENGVVAKLRIGGVAKLPHTKASTTKVDITKEKLSYDSVPSKTLKEYTSLRRKQAGKEPHAPRPASEKQKDAFSRLAVLDYFHKQGVEQGFEYFLEEDEQANRKFAGLARSLVKRYPDNWKEVIDWWFQEDHAWCDYQPSNFFSVSTWMKFDNRNNSKKERREVFKA